MKDLILGLIFWASFLLIMFILFAIADFIASRVTIKMIMAVMYIIMIVGTIYIFKN